jgi:hypothetical protein
MKSMSPMAAPVAISLGAFLLELMIDEPKLCPTMVTVFTLNFVNPVLTAARTCWAVLREQLRNTKVQLNRPGITSPARQQSHCEPSPRS